MLPAARVSDATAHGTPLTPGSGSTNVLIEGMPAWRIGSDVHVCPVPVPGGAPHAAEVATVGSTTVLINDLPAARLGDTLTGAGPPNTIVSGAPTVLIG